MLSRRRPVLSSSLRLVLCVAVLGWLAKAGAEGTVAASPVLKEGDVVSVNVFNEESLSGVFSVGVDGHLVFPLLGAIPAKGSTAAQVGERIKEQLEKDYIREAQVVAALMKESELPPDTVTVIGEVAAPGQVSFKQGNSMDLFTAVASAGGLAERANRNRIELKRRVGSDLQTHFLSLEKDRVFSLRNGDTVVVHAVPPEVVVVKEPVEPVSVTVIGAVKTPGVIKMNPEAPLDVVGAIASAGGFSNVARGSRVVVRRVTESGVQTFELNVTKMQRDGSKPFMLQANDTISVPESLF